MRTEVASKSCFASGVDHFRSSCFSAGCCCCEKRRDCEKLRKQGAALRAPPKHRPLRQPSALGAATIVEGLMMRRPVALAERISRSARRCVRRE